MKSVFGFVILSLTFVACAVETVDDTSSLGDMTSSLAEELDVDRSQEDPGLGALGDGCTTGFFSCEASCPFFGQRNIIVQVCDGVEVVVRRFPCTPEGCF